MTSSSPLVVLRGGRAGLKNPVTLDAGPYHPSGAIVADVDGDGHPDVVASAPRSDVLLVWKNDGHGGFGAPVVVDPLRNAAMVDGAGDFDGDGRADLVVSFDGTIRIFPNGCGL